MNKKSILKKQIEQLAGVEAVELVCVEPEMPDHAVFHVYFDSESVIDEETEEQYYPIDLNELIDYKNTQTHLYAKQGKKELRLTFNGSFEVWNGRIKLFETLQPFLAKEYFDNLNFKTIN